jgi:hypothetical protein
LSCHEPLRCRLKAHGSHEAWSTQVIVGLTAKVNRMRVGIGNQGAGGTR